jgi:parallel beta-helix repeat protein
MKRTKKHLAMALFLLGTFSIILAQVAAAQVVVTCPDQLLQAAIDSAPNNSTITVNGPCSENISIGTSRAGITLDGGGNATIIGPDTSTKPTVLISGRSITIKGFVISGGLDGILVVTGGIAVIDGNQIQATFRNGITVSMSSNVRIINNTIQNNPGYGISVLEMSSARIGFSNASDLTASENVIQKNGQAGILVMRSSYAGIVGNTISDNVLDGITVAKVSQADIASNAIDRNGGNGINVSDNSGVNLGNDTGNTIFDLPNFSEDPKCKPPTCADCSPHPSPYCNKKFGVKGLLGAYLDGRMGNLKGWLGHPMAASDPGDAHFVFCGGGCLNSLKR